MNKKALDFIKNFSYTVASNLISLVISTLVVLIVPKLIGVEEYGYWQLYIFYSLYLGFLHFGWNDGIYLRFGGNKYSELDKDLFFSQFYMLVASQIVIALGISISTFFYASDENRFFILQMISLSLVIVNSRYMLLFIMQATNRIKRFAQITMLDRILYVGIIIFMLAIGVRDYKLMIVADVIGKLVSLFFAMYYCKEIVFRKISGFYFSFNEAFLNIGVGIKLMLSTIASKFIIGIVKLGIERTWDISTFGKISLTLSVSNLVMLFINAVGIIMYPVLRRTREEKLTEIYITLRDILMVVLLGVLIFYYPLKSLLSLWLPEYAESLNYMAILFPIVIYEGKMSLLINTYLKTLRKEKSILIINIISLIISGVFTLITTVILKNLNLTIISIVVVLALRSIIAEILISRIIPVKVMKDIAYEIAVTAIFIFVSWTTNSILTVLIYAICYIIYLVIKRRDLLKSSKIMRIYMKA